MRTWLLAALGLLAACGPIPGGSLSGQVADVPADWTAALGGDHALCEIESRPDDPHSIQLECFLLDGSLYELKATEVSAAQERESVLAFRGYDPVPAGIVLFRFESRSQRS